MRVRRSTHNARTLLRACFVVLAFAGGSTAAACHLFLDSDDLVSGGGDGGNPTPNNPEGGVVGEGGGGVPVDLPDGFVWDASTLPEWKGQVPGCIPPPPLGAAPFAVVGGEPGTATFTCPTGYEPDPNTGPAYGGVIDVGLYCTKHQCACGAYNPSAPGGGNGRCEDLKLQYSNDPECATNIGTDDIDQGVLGCTRVDQAGATHAKVVGRVRATDQNCPPTGTAGIAKQPARFGLEVRLCVPKSNIQTCSDGLTPMPPTKDAVLCYRATGSNCAPGYTNQQAMSLDKTFNDTRGCQCQCDAKVDGGCTGGTVGLFTGTFGLCQSQQGTTAGTCQPIAAFGTNVRVTQAPTAAPGSVMCDPTDPRKTGNVTPGGQVMQLCCLSRCDACKLATISPNGTCLSVVNTCKTDSECDQYRQCAISRCNGNECNQCEQLSDAGPADSGFISQAALQKFRAIATCQRNACPAPECNN